MEGRALDPPQSSREPPIIQRAVDLRACTGGKRLRSGSPVGPTRGLPGGESNALAHPQRVCRGEHGRSPRRPGRGAGLRPVDRPQLAGVEAAGPDVASAPGSRRGLPYGRRAGQGGERPDGGGRDRNQRPGQQAPAPRRLPARGGERDHTGVDPRRAEARRRLERRRGVRLRPLRPPTGPGAVGLWRLHQRRGELDRRRGSPTRLGGRAGSREARAECHRALRHARRPLAGRRRNREGGDDPLLQQFGGVGGPGPGGSAGGRERPPGALQRQGLRLDGRRPPPVAQLPRRLPRQGGHDRRRERRLRDRDQLHRAVPPAVLRLRADRTLPLPRRRDDLEPADRPAGRGLRHGSQGSDLRPGRHREPGLRPRGRPQRGAVHRLGARLVRAAPGRGDPVGCRGPPSPSAARWTRGRASGRGGRWSPSAPGRSTRRPATTAPSPTTSRASTSSGRASTPGGSSSPTRTAGPPPGRHPSGRTPTST